MAFLSKLFGKGDGVAARAAKIDPTEWVARLEASSVFKTLQPDTVTEMCAHMQVLPVKAKTVLIQQGDEGDFFYILAEGSAQVSRQASMGADPTVLAELTAGASFGEEALISNAKRNATITMTTDGIVLRLSKDDFNALVKEPQLVWLSSREAQAKVAEGARWLDVRSAAEFQKGYLPGAISAPLDELRHQISQLSKDTLYICYCQTGRQSATAAFLLKQNGLQAAVLRGGIQRTAGT